VTAKLAAYWNIAVISPVCAEQQFLDKKVGYVSINMLYLKMHFAFWLLNVAFGPFWIQAYPTLTRVFGPFTKLGAFFVEICKHFGWQRIGIIHDNKPFWTVPSEGIKYVI